MRQLIHEALTSSLPLIAEIPADRWIQSGALDEIPTCPFAVYRIADAPTSLIHSVQPRLEVWVHDVRGSYLRIDRILDLVKEALAAAVPMEDSTHRIVCVEWTGDSPDLVDEGNNTNTRNTQFTITGRK